MRKIKIHAVMSVLFALVFFNAILISGSASHSQALEKQAKKYFVLNNGLQVFLYEKHTLPLLNIVAAVNFGSKDEVPGTNGIAHLLEHCILFRGTESRSSSQIIQDIGSHGAYYNAHTGQDLALFEISLLSKHADFALQNQRDILFNLKLDQKELDAEKEIILEEISQIEDDPFRYATSLAYQFLFKGHPYQNLVYGSKEDIRTITLQQVEEFYRKYFIPSNCSLAVVGDFDLREMEKKVRMIYGDLPKKDFSIPRPPKFEGLKESGEIDKELDVQKAYLVVGMEGPDYNHLDQYAVDVLTEILGRGLNPMLSDALRELGDLIKTVSMSTTTHKYGGVILLYFTLEPKYLSTAKRKVIAFLDTVKSKNFTPDDYSGEERLYAFDFLQSAKNQIRFAVNQSQENGLSIAASLTIYMLQNDRTGEQDYMANIDEIQTSDLRAAASKYFNQNNYVIISILPHKKP